MITGEESTVALARITQMIMLRLRACLSVPFVVVALLSPSGAADQWTTPQQFNPIRALIRERLAQSQIPSISVAVARDGKIIWEEGFGWADREKKIPANEHTMSRWPPSRSRLR